MAPLYGNFVELKFLLKDKGISIFQSIEGNFFIQNGIIENLNDMNKDFRLKLMEGNHLLMKIELDF